MKTHLCEQIVTGQGSIIYIKRLRNISTLVGNEKRIPQESLRTWNKQHGKIQLLNAHRNVA